MAVEGRIQVRTYDDKNGQRRWITEIICDSVQFLDRKGTDINVGNKRRIMVDIQDVIKHLEIKKKDIELCIGLIKQGNQFIPRQSSPLLEAISVAIETLKAKADGRLIVLPCKEFYEKEGDTLFLIDGGEVIEVTHCGAQVDFKGNIYAVVAMEDEDFRKDVFPDDFGKTVFLTREEAERALREQAIDK